jgi:hypothetical protein
MAELPPPWPALCRPSLQPRCGRDGPNSAGHDGYGPSHHTPCARRDMAGMRVANLRPQHQGCSAPPADRQRHDGERSMPRACSPKAPPSAHSHGSSRWAGMTNHFDCLYNDCSVSDSARRPGDPRDPRGSPRLLRANQKTLRPRTGRGRITTEWRAAWPAHIGQIVRSATVLIPTEEARTTVITEGDARTARGGFSSPHAVPNKCLRLRLRQFATGEFPARFGPATDCNHGHGW